MGINLLNRLKGRTVLYRLADLLRWLIWVVRYAVIWPLATMALMVLFLFWKDNTTAGQMMAQQIDYVREIAPAGQFPIGDCPEVHEMIYLHSFPRELSDPLDKRCTVIFTDAAGYIEETDRSLGQLGKALWSTLALLYVSLAVMTGNRPYVPREFKYGTRMATGQVIYSENKTSGKEGDGNV
ncbi:conjugal transfer protein TraP [Salmonella enterica]|nr:conjugal transfer protein TraP [Salmonella enterica]ECL8858997.1 conjugal transfer protein TraP [Salmonella enterica]EEB2924106.1 conjugal transfer protein TraP [Salmonella enterica]EEK4999802.1 conjugal transfer protein TraP [Salmonella enterica]EHD9191190.1 conjugal transfer protein TraP [Salmonella enterica]